MQRKVDLIKIKSITVSLITNELIINIPSEYDYRYEINKKE